MQAKRDNRSVILTLKIKPEPLTGRVCACGQPNFREVEHTLQTYTAKCANCAYTHAVKPCGRVVQFAIPFNGPERVTRCGDVINSSTCTDDSVSTMPLAVCLTCNRLVALQ